MGIFTLPITYLGGLLFTLFVIIMFTAGSFAFDQMWTRQALNNATTAGITQVTSDGATAGSVVLNSADALDMANKVWNAQNESWTPTGQPISASFATSAVNPTTPPGDFDTITGTAQVTFKENAVNNFINTLNSKENAVYGGTITDTVSSTLPEPIN